MNRRKLTGALLAAFVIAAVAAAAALPSQSASSAFGGKNGRIAFNAGGAIYLAKPDGSGLTRLAETHSDEFSGGVSFSRDGQWLAFSAYRGSDPDIYVIRTDGSGRRQVTFSRGTDVDPTWSPTGTRIAFETNRNGGQVDIYSTDERGRDLKRLTAANEHELDPAWSPRGDKIAYTVETASRRQIWVMNADGSGKSQLTDSPNFSENPNWSPDGGRIVFDSDRAEKGDLDLYSMKPDGSGLVRLTNHPALDALPAYSPDGKSLVFVSDRLEKDSRRLFVMPVDGGSVRRVIRTEEPTFQMVPDWQPLRAGTLERPPSPPGRMLGRHGVDDRVDGLYDAADAWAMPMESGVTYRINLSLRRGCASVSVFPPGVRSFAPRSRVAYRSCGGYFAYTPGPGRGGVHSLLVAAEAGSESVVAYHLQAASAGPDDQGPGIHLAAHGERMGGSLSAGGIDVEDLYSFDVHVRSAVRIGLSSPVGLSLDLTTVTGALIDRGSAGQPLRKTLAPGTYVVAVTAPPRLRARYALAVLVRAVTKTSLTVDRKRTVRIPLGQSVLLQTGTKPLPAGGVVRMQLEYRDPRAGWVFRRSWTVAPGSSVSFAPPAIGLWRVRASFFGTLTSSPSRSHEVMVSVVSSG